jgi:hypothetical protein
VAAENVYDPGLVYSFSGSALQVATSATGTFSATAGGSALPVYDLNGSPIANLVTNSVGYLAPFRVDDPNRHGWVQFGSIVQHVFSTTAFELAVDAADAKAAALAAQASASASATAASAAQAAAEAALADVGTTITDPEVVRDTMATALVAGANISITVNDAGDTITIAAAGTDVEVVRDTIGSALVSAGYVAITVNDAGDTITIGSTTALQTALDAKAVVNDSLTSSTTATYSVTKILSSIASVANEPAGSLLVVAKTGGVWPGGTSSTGVRPTSRSDVVVAWKGPEPSPAFITSGTAGMLQNVDVRWITP